MLESQEEEGFLANADTKDEDDDDDVVVVIIIMNNSNHWQHGRNGGRTEHV